LDSKLENDLEYAPRVLSPHKVMVILPLNDFKHSHAFVPTVTSRVDYSYFI